MYIKYFKNCLCLKIPIFDGSVLNYLTRWEIWFDHIHFDKRIHSIWPAILPPSMRPVGRGGAQVALATSVFWEKRLYKSLGIFSRNDLCTTVHPQILVLCDRPIHRQWHLRSSSSYDAHVQNCKFLIEISQTRCKCTSNDDATSYERKSLTWSISHQIQHI